MFLLSILEFLRSIILTQKSSVPSLLFAMRYGTFLGTINEADYIAFYLPLSHVYSNAQI